MATKKLVRWSPGSSAIRRGVYSPSAKTLAVQFKHGGVYTYKGVSPQRMAAVLRSNSAGRAYNDSIKRGAGVESGGKLDVRAPGSLRGALGLTGARAIAGGGRSG